LAIRSPSGYWKVSLLTLCGAVLLPGSVWAQRPTEHPAGEALSKSEIGTRLFLEQIQPLLEKNCLACHSYTTKQAELDLSSREGLLEEGKHGPAVVPGDGKDSRILGVITHSQQPAMPPQKEKLPLRGGPRRPLD